MLQNLIVDNIEWIMVGIIIPVVGVVAKIIQNKRKNNTPTEETSISKTDIQSATDSIKKEIQAMKKELDEYRKESNEKITSNHVIIDKLNTRLSRLEGKVDVLVNDR